MNNILRSGKEIILKEVDSDVETFPKRRPFKHIRRYRYNNRRPRNDLRSRGGGGDSDVDNNKEDGVGDVGAPNGPKPQRKRRFVKRRNNPPKEGENTAEMKENTVSHNHTFQIQFVTESYKFHQKFTEISTKNLQKYHTNFNQKFTQVSSKIYTSFAKNSRKFHQNCTNISPKFTEPLHKFRPKIHKNLTQIPESKYGERLPKTSPTKATSAQKSPND